ncbi:LppX_LprAFG lipoprotein [Chloroflexus sp.]|uniref:LppX_LprAFG lipoprotein n=1 Tax=Chloroflexus sp. TaxID=1904827 RepID=UPI0029FBEDFA|nr:LppX_LprAFG lipoprotein [Chloroflexus sp.]MCS6887090.1 LppX_LprAFG lipoprotein [Chloroflexus sp.]MCX7858621.1 LppX_LprAFG lipoprotein [Chloroflexus sp.]
MRQSWRWLVMSLVLWLVACGGVAAPPTPTPTPDPRALAAAIGQATQNSQSAHFRITLTGKPVALDASGVTVLNSIEGDLRRPDAVLSILNITLGNAIGEIRTVSLAGKQYTTNPITRQWMCLQPGSTFDPAILFAPDVGIEALLANNFADVTLVGIEDLNGRPHYHLRGTLPAEQLRAISLNLLGAGPVTTDLWADQATMRASRVVLVDTATDATNPSTWTLEFSEYDKTVDVREPVQCP